MIVREANDDQAKQDIEITSLSAYPRKIVFVQDGAGKWFITYTTMNSIYFDYMYQLMFDNTHDILYTPPVEEEG